jgi:hypothetical protein
MPFSCWYLDRRACAASTLSRSCLVCSLKYDDAFLAGSFLSWTVSFWYSSAKALATAAANCGSAPLKLISTTDDSREGTISSFFTSRSASQSRAVPWPPVAWLNCSITAGLLARCSVSTTCSATFLLPMMSIWVAI